LQAVAENVWGDNVITTLDVDATRADKIGDFADSLGLATTIPIKQMRATLGDLSREYWDEGPDELRVGEKFGDWIHDPGLLVVVKRIPRKDEPKEQKARTKRGEAARAAGGSAARRRGRRPGAEPPRSEKEDKARYQWMQSTEDLVHSLNNRFLTASQAGAGQRHMIADLARAGRASPNASSISTTSASSGSATGSSGETPVSRPGRFPLELHEGAHILAEYHVCWPDDLPKRLQNSQVTPLAVHYVRTQDTATMTKINTHYLKQLKGVNGHVRSYGRWLDWMGQGVEHGQARTVDVMITRANPVADEDEEESPASRRGAEEPEVLGIEILVVEIPEYRASPVEEESATAK
jgi:hypothetical protein